MLMGKTGDVFPVISGRELVKLVTSVRGICSFGIYFIYPVAERRWC